MKVVSRLLARLPRRRETHRPDPDPDAQTRFRLRLAMIAFSAVFLVIGGRLAVLATMPPTPIVHYLGPGESVSHARPDILDRSGTVLATDIMVPSVYAEPHRVIDIDYTVEQIATVLPDIDTADLRRKLASGKRFAWVQREISPRQRRALHALGLPGIDFVEENQRFYPAGRVTSHVLGHVNIDNQGIAGLERHLDDDWLGVLHSAGMARLTPPDPVSVTIDVRVQHALRDELYAAMNKFDAIAAAGIVLDVNSGEVAALVSLPDYDPHKPVQALDADAINRITTGVYELGSTFKSFTVAMGLDTGTATLDSRYDARSPIRVGGHAIDDYHGKKRVLSLSEVFTYSSNIGTARIALDVDAQAQQDFLRRLGFFDRVVTELPESGSPIVPKKWPDITRMTVSFGHGLSVSPMHAAVAGAALVNGGRLVPPTFLPRESEEAEQLGRQVLRPDTSELVRRLMRLNVESGTAGNAEVVGYRVGGKTGTAEKVVKGRYSSATVLSNFIGVFPMDDPQYLVLVMLDEPKGIEETHGFRTSGWNTAPTTSKVVERIAPLLGVRPRMPPVESEGPISASY